MVVPLFIILMLLVNGFFILFMGQQIMCHAFVQSAKSLAFDPYASQRVAADEDDKLADLFVDVFTIGDGNFTYTGEWGDSGPDDLPSVAAERFLAYVRPDEEAAENLLEYIGIKDGVDGIDFSESSVEDGVLTLKANYVQQFVFNAAGLTDIDRTLCVKVNLFQYKS